MSEGNPFPAEDVQGLENVLGDTPMPAVTRRDLLSKAAVGTAAVGVFGAVGPIPPALASNTTVCNLIDTAVTLEALAVTFVSAVVENASKIGIASNLVPVLKAANAAEYDHYKALRRIGAKPLTTKFWAPNSVIASSNAVFATVEYVETQFINAYLIAVTAFAKAGMDSTARYAAEILGVEAEHRALARFAQGKLPDNLGFEVYKITTIGGIVGALEAAGVGFGTQGQGPGAFYTYKKPSSSVLETLSSNRPA
jgi:Ferritin-like domain